MVTVTKFSDTIPPQEYEQKRDKVIELLTEYKEKDVLKGLSYLIKQLKLDENISPAYVVGRMENEGILENGAFYDVTDDNKWVMTYNYKEKYPESTLSKSLSLMT